MEQTQGTVAPEALTNGAVAIETPAPEAKKDDFLSPKFAALARKEKELRMLQKQIQQERDSIKTRDEEYSKSYVPKARLMENPLAALSELGLTQDQLVNLILNGPQQVDPTVSALQKQIQAIEAQQQSTSKAMEEAQAKQYEQALSQIRSDTAALVASNPDYETIRETGSTEAVVELIRQTFDSEGILLTIDDAAKQVEDHLLEEALKMARLKKVQAKLTPAQVEEAVATLTEPKKPQIIQKSQQDRQPILKTLTNAATTTSSRTFSAAEKRARAIAAFKGQLT